jgi:hypothetical protein
MGEKNLDDLYVIAEQILMGNRALSEYTDLHEEDLERVKRIIARGPSALSERLQQVDLYKKQLHRKLHFKTAAAGYVYIRDLPDLDPVNILKGIPFTPFPFSKIVPLELTLKQRILQSWIANMSMIEIGVLVQQMNHDDSFLFVKECNPRYGIQMEELFARDEEEEAPVDLEEILAKYSILTVDLLRESQSISADLKKYIANYWAGLRDELNAYCCDLPFKMGMVAMLNEFNSFQWKRLAGLTARKDMALFAPILKKELFEKLVTPLPIRQKGELKEEIECNKKRDGEGLEQFTQIIQQLKLWYATIIKVSRSSGPEGE